MKIRLSNVYLSESLRDIVCQTHHQAKLAQFKLADVREITPCTAEDTCFNRIFAARFSTNFSLKWYSGHAAFSNWNRREVAVCPFYSIFWVEFWRILFPGKFWGFQNSAVKKVVIPKNTVSCNSRCFWVSRRLVSFLESSEQISRFGAAFKKPPPKRRFLVHQQGLEPGTRWLRVSCSTNWANGANSFQVPSKLNNAKLP